MARRAHGLRGIISAKLLVVEGGTDSTGDIRNQGGLGQSPIVGSVGPVQAVVDQARARWAHRPREIKYPPILSEGILLYSYSPPGNTSHVSPFAIIRRIHHLIRKKHLYMSADGEVYRPGVEIPVGEEGNGDFEDRLEAGLPGLRTVKARSYGLVWAIILILGKAGVTLVRRVNSERVIALYNAKDKSYFGSLYVRGGRYFVSVHGPRSSDVVRGAGDLLVVIRGEE